MKKISFFGSLSLLVMISTFLLVGPFASPVKAENMKSNSYYLQFGNFNMGSGKFDPGSNYNVSYTLGGTAVGPYGKYGTTDYFLGSGFQYIYQIDQFTFALSKLAIDFGELTAADFGTDSHTITINTGSAGGYTVYAFENQPLTHISSTATIPDTNCNAGCSETVAGIWDDASNAGFGYHIFADNTPTDFVNDTYFRRFPDASLGEDMAAIMASDNIAIDDQATMTYQAAMTGNQVAGNYQTSIVFVAVPGY